MRYHYEKPNLYSSMYGATYTCNHLVFNECTLYSIRNKGLAVVQQRYCADTKMTYWGRIDPWLVDELYLHKNFQKFFNERSRECIKSLYPTVTIRQMMRGA